MIENRYLTLYRKKALHFPGLDEFEEKVDKVADGQDDKDWISQLYRHIVPDLNHNYVPEESDVPDPPILDTTWGLGGAGNTCQLSINLFQT